MNFYLVTLTLQVDLLFKKMLWTMTVDSEGLLIIGFFSGGPHYHKSYYPSCTCAADLSGFICSGSDSYSVPPHFRVVTKDTLQNITGTDTHKFILYTQDPLYRLHRLIMI